MGDRPRSWWSKGRGPRGTRVRTARAGLRTGQACHRGWTAYGTFCRHTPKVGAECPNWARSDLCGGRSVMGVPTAINSVGAAVGEIFAAVWDITDGDPRT